MQPLVTPETFGVDKTIEGAETALLQYDQVGCPVYHHFGPGVYIREVMIPAGTLAIGHMQKTTHLNVFLKGKVLMLTPDGDKKLLEAPMIFTSEPGRKIGYITEDMVWLNIYSTTERDIKVLEDTYLDKSDAFKQHQTSLLDLKKAVDIADYLKMLEDENITEDTVRAQSEATDDLCPFTDTTITVVVDDSTIDKKGLFTTAPIQKGAIICKALVGGKRTPAGRFTNHAKDPNAVMVADNQRSGTDIFLVSLCDIDGCFGGGKGTEITVNYRDVLRLKRSLLCQP